MGLIHKILYLKPFKSLGLVKKILKDKYFWQSDSLVDNATTYIA